MRKIGFLGGTFDPIHFGHLSLAISLFEEHQLDEVLFCPAATSPHKQHAPPYASKEDRLHMLKLALNSIEQFKILDWEIKQKGPSYTIDTIRRLRKEERDAEIYLLLGEDQNLSIWKDVKELIELSPPLIGSRQTMQISSTLVRERLKKRLYCEHLVPHLALDYIYENHLYS